MKKHGSISIAVLAIGLAASPATAQTLVAGQGVADRARPDYDPIGGKLGPFTAYPSISATADATDNYLATDTNRKSDEYLTVRPELALTSNWAQDRLDARFFVSQSVHANLPNENATQFGVSTSGALDLDRETRVTSTISIGRYVEDRSSLGSLQGSSEPVHYDAYDFGIGITHAFNDLTLGASTDVTRRNYYDVKFPNGAVIDQDYRDVRSVSVAANAKYSLRNGIGLIVSGSYSDERYDFRPGSPGFIPGIDTNRDSKGFNIQGGITLELTSLVYGSIQIGYLQQSYADPSLRNVGGLSYSADLLWNVTPLTTLRFQASRSVQDTSLQGIAGNTVSEFRVLVDHELYRYIILSADAGYGSFTPNGIGIGGDQYDIGGGARYLIDRHFSVTGGIRYSARTSDSTFLRYHAITGNVGLRYAF